jgi:cytochrome c-type biogenesis protein CcmH/NrfG
LKLAATLDPERPETYVTAAFWLRTRLGKAHEAEQFLRQGLQANPAHPELLFELGRIYRDSHKDAAIARRIWDMALTEWHKKQRSLEEDSDRLIYLQLTIQLAKLAEEEKDFASAINYLKFLLNVSPSKQAISKRIADLQARLTNAAPAN